MKFLNIKKLLLLFIPLTVLSYLAINSYYDLITNNELKIIRNGAENELNIKSQLVQEIYESLIFDIEMLKWDYNKGFNHNNKANEKKNLETSFLHFAKLQRTFDQLRYIDTLGKELIRIDFSHTDKAQIQPKHKLQDKKDRYYFQSARKLKSNEIYFSRIDLNMEYGKIEIPHEPVLRVAVKTYDKENRWNGLIIINYFLRDLLGKIQNRQNELFTKLELLNSEGFFLSSADTNKNFSHLISDTDSLALFNTNKNLWKKIQMQNSGSCEQDYAIYLFKKLSFIGLNDIKAIHEGKGELIFINTIDLKQISKTQNIFLIYKWISLALLLLLVFLGLAGFQYYTNRLSKQNKLLDNTNKNLEKLKQKLEESLKLKLEELNLTERKFYTIFNNASIGVAIVDMEGRPVNSNKKLTTILGYSDKELMELTFTDFTHPDDLDVDIQQFKQLLDRKIDSYNMEKRYIRKDGSVMWGDLDVSLLLDAKNNIVNIIGVVKDITDKKEKDIKLFENAQLINQITEAIISTDNDGKINYWNKGAEHLFGYSSSEIVNKSIRVLYPPEEWEKTISKVVNTLKTKISISFESQLVKKNGVRFYAEISISRKYDNEGNITGRIGSATDITKRKNDKLKLQVLNNELNTNLNFLNNIMEYSPFAMWIANPNGDVIRTNQTLRNILQLEDHQIVGTYNVLQDQNLMDQGVMPLTEKVFSEHAVSRFEIKWTENKTGQKGFKKNKEYWMDINLFPIIDTNGALQNVVCQWVDISERVANEKAVKKSKAMLQSITTSAQDAIILIDNEGTVVFWNPAAEVIFGYTEDEMLGKTFHRIIPPKKYLKDHLKHFEYYRKSGKGRLIGKNTELEAKHKEGYIIPVELSLSATKLNDQWGATAIIRDITLRKQTENEIINHRNKISRILEVAPAGIGQVVNRVFTEVNTRFCEMVGYTKNELIGQNSRIIYPTQVDFDKVGLEKYKQIKKYGTGRVETRFKTKDGKILYIDMASTLIEKGNLSKGSIFTALDITEQKKAEQELLKHQKHLEVLVQERTTELENTNDQLRENQYRLDAAFTSSGYAWYDARLQKDILITHYTKYKSLGFHRDEIQSTISWWFQLTHPADHEILKKVEKDINSGINSFSYEIRYRHKNGNYLWFSERGSVIERDDNGTPIRTIGTSEDITGRKEIELELAKLKSAVEQSPVVVVITNAKGLIEYTNPAFKSLTGYTFEEVKGKSPRILNARILPKSVYSNLWQTILSGKTWNGELCNKTKYGKIFWENAVITPVFDDKGTIANFIAVKENITERKKFIEKLEQAKLEAEAGNRAKSEFLANMSHEIRTPMNAVIGFTDILSRKLKDPVNLKHLESIKVSSKSLLNIINDILDLSKIEAAKIEIRKSNVNILKIFKELETMFKVQAENKGLSFETNIAELKNTSIRTDEVRIRQILYNLISNAIKFTHEGQIRIILKKEQITDDDSSEKHYKLRFEVEDTGIGISKNMLDKVFESFVQQEGQDFKEYGGTGLGLSISKKLAKLLDGDIVLKSKEKIGSQFTLILNNVVCVENIETVHSKTEQTEYIFESSRILVVDDIESNLNYMQDLLHDLGFLVHTANNGLEGMQALERKKTDLIITDIRMPKLDGFGFLNQLRNGKNSNIPCIAATASVLKGELSILEKFDFNAILLKPIQSEELIKVLKQYLPYRKKKKDDHSKSQDKTLLSEKELQKESVVLKEQIEPLLAKLEEQQSFEDLNSLADLILDTAIKYDNKALNIYSEKLIDAIDAFDIETIMELLSKLRKFIKTNNHGNKK